MNLWPLLAIAVLVVGFAAGLNPLIVILVTTFVAGITAGIAPLRVLAALGHAYNSTRYVSLIWLILPVIGLLEHEGLRERARTLISRLRTATTGRIILVYLGLRQLTAALGLSSLGGPAQMVRPIVAPMAEGAAESRFGAISERMRHVVRAYAASADNVGAFFGEDIFIAISSILLIKGFLAQSGYHIAPFRLSVWAIPTALLAFLIHGMRLWRLDAKLARMARDGSDRDRPA